MKKKMKVVWAVQTWILISSYSKIRSHIYSNDYSDSGNETNSRNSTERDWGDVEEVKLGETEEIELDEKPEEGNNDQRNVQILYESRMHRKHTYTLPVASPKRERWMTVW